MLLQSAEVAVKILCFCSIGLHRTSSQSYGWPHVGWDYGVLPGTWLLRILYCILALVFSASEAAVQRLGGAIQVLAVTVILINLPDIRSELKLTLLHPQVGLASGHSLGGDWRLRPGRPALAGQTNSATTLDLFLPTSGVRPSYGAMVERRDGSSWLGDDDDNDDPQKSQ